MAQSWKIIFIVIIVFVFSFQVSNAATLEVSPANGVYGVGDVIVMQIKALSDVPLNAISGVLSFPPIFSIQSVSKANSILNFWVSEPSFSNNPDTVKFEGVTLGGFSGKTGTVLTVRLKAVKEGSGTVSFKSGQILANDGQGTNITSNLGTFSYEIKPGVAKPSISEEAKKPEPQVEKPELPQAPATLESPELVVRQSFGEQVIIGTSRHSKGGTLITFQSRDGTKIIVQGETDGTGGFSVPIPTALRRGIYTVSALVITSDHLYTTPSNEVTITVGSPFSDLSSEAKLIAVILILIILYLVVNLFALFFKFRRKKKRIQEESQEAQDTVRKSFKLINKDVSDQVSTREMRKDLKTSEESITKDIKEIEEL